LRRWAEAEAAARALIAAHPSNPRSHLNLGWVFDDQDREEEALAAYAEALAIDPTDPTALQLQVNALRGLRRWAEAETAAREAIQARPHTPDLRVELGRVLDDQGREEEALAAYAEALSIDPTDPTALQLQVSALRGLRRWAEAETVAREAIQARPHAPDLRVELGWVLDGQGREEEALAAYAEALAIDSGHERALQSRVTALRGLRRWAEAEAAARALIAAHPRDPGSHLNLGLVFDDQDRDEEALAAYAEALAVDPTDPTALQLQVTALRGLRRWAEAETAAREAIQARPHTPDLRVELGWVLDDQGREEEALAAFGEALSIDAGHEWALRSRVSALRGLRRWAEAEAAARALIAAHPRDPGSHLNLGWVFKDQDRDEEALAAFTEALAIDPTDPTALEWRVSALRGLRRWAEAETAAREAIQARPHAPDLRVELGWVLDDQGREEEALAAFAEALSIDARHKWALRSRVSALQGLRRWAEAEAAARALIAAHPRDPLSHLNLGWVFDDQDRDEEALAAYAEALAIDPTDPTALQWRVTALRGLRRWAEAETAAREAIQARPHAPDLRVELGWVLDGQGREEEALAAYAEALAIDARHERALQSRVSALRGLRRWAEAEAAARALITAHPRDPGSHLNLGWVFKDQDREEEALAAFTEALAVDPTDQTALEWRVSALRGLRRWAEAEAAAREAIQARPHAPDLHVELGWVFKDQQRYASALACAEQALGLDPMFWPAREQRVELLLALLRFDDAEAAAREYLAERPDSVPALLLLARVLDALHRYPEALAAYERVLDLDRTDADVVTGMSATLRSMRCFDEAEDLVLAAIRQRPHNMDLPAELAFICRDNGDQQGADSQFRLLLERASSQVESAKAWNGRGWVAISDGRHLDAIRYFADAAGLDPGDPQHRIGLAWAHLRVGGRDDIAEAERLCRAVLVEDAHSHLAHTCLGMVAHQRGKHAGAERHFRRSVELAPYDGCHVDLGALYAQLGRYAQAEQCLRRALELDAWNTQARVELGSLYLQRSEQHPQTEAGIEDTSRASNEFRQALKIDRNSGSAALGLALARARGPGDLTDAEATLREALRRNVADQPAWQLHLALARLLIQTGDATQQSEFYASAVKDATAAIRLAAEQAEPYFVAGVAEQRLGNQTNNLRLQVLHRRHARGYFKKCEEKDPDHAETHHALRLLDQEIQAARGSGISAFALAGIATAILAVIWVDFVWKHHVTAVMATTLTPIMVGLIAIGLLLPLLVRLKLPGGMEADLSASLDQVSPGPTGQVSVDPPKFPSITGPTGQIPRLQ
jgi:tetratricopeptide (TPR) repeat protein